MSLERISDENSRAIAPSTDDSQANKLAVPEIRSILAKTDKVRVVHGSKEKYFDIAGQDVGKIRKKLRESFNIPADANAYVNGQPVEDDYVLNSGTNLEFSKEAGQKGL